MHQALVEEDICLLILKDTLAYGLDQCATQSVVLGEVLGCDGFITRPQKQRKLVQECSQHTAYFIKKVLI